MQRRRRAGRGCLALALATGLVACAINPVTGQREILTMSPAREAALGEQAAAQVEQQIGLVRTPRLNAYVDAIGQRLARLSPRQDVSYRFFVADMPEPNAFALPGGYIYVSRGLLALSNSEDELANVIGHEIGHVAARHAAQRETRSLGVGLLSVLGTVAAAAAGGEGAAQAVAQLGQVAGAGLIASYSRDQERQADEVGQQLAASSGWDPRGMAQFMQTLGREEELRTGSQRMPGFLDSHPVTTERVRDNSARAAELVVRPVAPVARDREAFLAQLDGLLVGPDPAEGVFRGQRFLHPVLDFALEFPEGWKTVNQKQAVGAQAPREDAVVVLELDGEGGDPRSAAARWAQANKVRLAEGASVRIGGMNAYRTTTVVQREKDALALDLTWIAHPRGLFRVMGVSPAPRFPAYAPSFSATAGSFRGLRSDERAAIREQRLRVVSARAGESLAALSARSGNRWSPEETAVANGLAAAARLDAGQPVKIAVEVPFSR